jgi:hypothetical protein
MSLKKKTVTVNSFSFMAFLALKMHWELILNKKNYYYKNFEENLKG